MCIFSECFCCYFGEGIFGKCNVWCCSVFDLNMHDRVYKGYIPGLVAEKENVIWCESRRIWVEYFQIFGIKRKKKGGGTYSFCMSVYREWNKHKFFFFQFGLHCISRDEEAVCFCPMKGNVPWKFHKVLNLVLWLSCNENNVCRSHSISDDPVRLSWRNGLFLTT